MGRKKAYPTGMDDGCEVCLKCLDCPLSACKYDDPRPYLAWKGQQVYTEISELTEKGYTISQIGPILGIDDITIRRLSRRVRKGGQD